MYQEVFRLRKSSKQAMNSNVYDKQKSKVKPGASKFGDQIC